MLGGTGSPGGDELLTVTVVRDALGYGMKVSGDNPVYVQSVKEHGAAWRAGLRSGDRILRVDSVPVHHHTHQQVVHMIRANPSTVLTVQQHAPRHKTPITAPVPVNSEKLRQLEVSKVQTVRLMLEQDQKYIRDLRNELSKVPDVRKQAELESAEARCAKLQHEIDTIMASQPASTGRKPASPPPQHTGFLSGLPRSLSNLTGQSLRNLRQARHSKLQETPPPLVRQNSDEAGAKRRHGHNNTVPMVPTTCLDNVSPPPLPPRYRTNPPNPIQTKPKPGSSVSPVYKGRYPMHQSMPAYERDGSRMHRSSHSLDGELDGPKPNSIAMQMSYPLVNAPPPPLQTDNRGNVPVLHVRSQSSPEHLEYDVNRSSAGAMSPLASEKDPSWRGTPPPGTPPPPYAHNTQPCADPQRAIISMEEDDSPASDNSSHSGLFSNMRAVRESKARMAVLLNWLLAERRCAYAGLLLVLTDGYRAAAAAAPTLRRWAYEIQSTFLMPNAVLQLNGVDENMANEIEHVLVNEFDKEEILRTVFRKARAAALEQLQAQLAEFQGKRRLGLATLYGPEDALLERCDQDKQQEQIVVERVLCARLSSLTSASPGSGGVGGVAGDAHQALVAAVVAAALALQCRPASVAAAAGGARASFLQRDKLYKQRVKQLAKNHPQPFVVRGHHLQLQALTSVGHCHHCDLVIWGLAPQAYVCTDCKLRVHRSCARGVEEGCCLGRCDDAPKRGSRLIDRIHPAAANGQPPGQDSNDKKSRKASSTSHFINMERSVRKIEDEPWDQTLTPAAAQGEPRREGSTDETAAAAEVDGDADSIAKETPDKDHAWRSPSGGVRGVNRAESCRERDAPRRGKHRNASDPNRRANVDHRDLEPGAPHVPSGSSSSSSLSSRSNESNTAAAPADHQASQSDWSEEDEPLAAQWADSLPTHVLDSLLLSPRLRKRQEVIHELIVSEGSHVRWLKVLGGVFLRPLETQGALLPPEELRALFPNLPAVRERHQRLYMDLRALRQDSNNHVVPVRPLAEAMLNTLGEVNYATHLSRFCRGQRMALEALRERRRKSKELHQFLAAREQLPLCGRLQLKDLLACVWQRLTKYQLLLESILKTMSETDNDCSGECDSEDDIARLRKALDTAKDVLQGVDMAIRTAENEHRLRTIQSKLEIRIAATGGEWDEARRLDLPSHTLKMEGELAVRNDNNKKTNVLALMLSDCLVLLQREGERFALKPLPAGAGRDPLAPLVRWEKVLFRPNAACRNTFFLMNINGVQMHELSTSTNNEYATWVKHIQELPLAKPELKQAIPTPLHQPSRSIDEPGSNVSRKPSDASEKSNSIPGDDNESERDRQSLDRTSTERERDDKRSVEREERRSMDKEEAADREEKHKTRRPTVGRISTHCSSPPPPLLPPAAVRVAPPAAAMAQTARTAITHQEHLRRLDESISSALSAKCAVVAAALGLPAGGYAHLADLAVADTLGLVDVPTELRQTGSLSRTGSVEEEPTASPAAANAAPPDMHQLLLAAQAQVNQLSECLSGALSASAATVVGATARGRCDQCRPHRHRPNSDNTDASPSKTEDLSTPDGEPAAPVEPDALEALECDLGAAQLARRLVGLSSGLQGTVSALLCALPALAAERRTLRSELCASRQRAARLQTALLNATQGQAPPPYDCFALTDEISYPKEGGDQTIQDQPSNGG